MTDANPPELSRCERGFTLPELLVALAIVSVLAGLALSQFISHRQRTFDMLAETDLKNAVIAEEALFASNEDYVECDSRAACEALLPEFDGDESVELSFQITGTAEYVAEATHALGALRWRYDSITGRFSSETI